MKMPKLRRGRERSFCKTEKETRQVKCESVRVMEDGTEQKLAGFDVDTDSQCHMVKTNMYENEDGALSRLEKKYESKI